MDNIKQNNSTEAPASATVTCKTPGGFEVLLTSRDFDNKELTRKQLAHLLNLDKALIASGFSPVVRGFGKQQKPIEYVPDRLCPTCQNKLVYGTKKDGEKFIKCSMNKWNFQLQKAEGCPFVEFKKIVHPAYDSAYADEF